MSPLDAELLGDLARRLAAEGCLDGALQRIVDASVAEIEGADHAGVTLLTPAGAITCVATDDLVGAVDEHQYALDEGPCLSAARREAPVVRAGDLASDERWPRFGAAAVPLGVRAMLSFPLYANRETIGALNVYAGTVDPFTEDSVALGSLFAAHAALAATADANDRHLRVAIETRDVIGQAKGILMERYRLDAARAFDLLVAVSQHSNTKLRDVAAQLAETGAFTRPPGTETSCPGPPELR